MEGIISIIIGMLSGIVVAAIFTIKSEISMARKLLKLATVLLTMSVVCYVIVIKQNATIDALERKSSFLISENADKEKVIKELKEKLLTQFEIKNLYDVVLDTKALPAIPFAKGHEQLIADRRMATSDNAFYVAFANYYQVKNQGANFQINLPKENDDGEKTMNINVSRFSIKKIKLGDYVYSFSIPEMIEPNSGAISLRVTKELDVKMIISTLLK